MENNEKDIVNQLVNGGLTIRDIPARAESQPNNLDCQEKNRTLGNKIFDWGVYSSVAFAGVTAVSLLVAHQAKSGSLKSFEWLRTGYKNISKGLSTHIFEKILNGRPREDIEQWANDTTMYGMLAAGGTTLMPVIKYMEDNRQKLAAKIDNALGSTQPYPKLIEQEPKQSWLSVMSGRATSIAVSFSAFLLMGPKISEAASAWTGKKLTNSVVSVAPNVNIEKTGKLAKLLAFDAIFTAITAAVTYVASRTVAKKHDKTYHENCEQPAAQAFVMESEMLPLTRSYAETIEPHEKSVFKKSDSFRDAVANAQANQTAQVSL